MFGTAGFPAARGAPSSSENVLALEAKCGIVARATRPKRQSLFAKAGNLIIGYNRSFSSSIIFALYIGDDTRDFDGAPRGDGTRPYD